MAWIADTSSESGAMLVPVRPFPDGDRVWAVTRHRLRNPELVYADRIER